MKRSIENVLQIRWTEGQLITAPTKKRVQWLNEALCFVSSFVVAGSLVLRNRQLLVAANLYLQS